jgi:hypothetical protein
VTKPLEATRDDWAKPAPAQPKAAGNGKARRS